MNNSTLHSCPNKSNLFLTTMLQSLQVDFTQEYFWTIYGMLAGGVRDQEGAEETPVCIIISEYGWKLNLTLGVDQKKKKKTNTWYHAF